MRTWWLTATLGLLAVSTHTNVSVAETSSLFTASSASLSSSFTGATFTPKVAPVVVPSISSRSVVLAWPEVTSARPVTYVVTRTGPPGTTAQVCTGENTPSASNGVARCTDTSATAGVPYTYSQRPVLDVPGSTPWSLAASVPSQSVTAPRLTYIDSGPDVSSIGPVVSVPYPSSTQVGDLLLLIAICSVNKAPALPAGWTQAVSRGISGSSNVHLLVAWRVADGSTSVSLDPKSNGSGTSARILNYGRFQGNLANPLVATSSAVNGTAIANQTLTPSPDVVTTGTHATVISIVAMSAANSLSLTTPRSFTERVSANLFPGSGALSLGVADTTVATTGSSAPSPTWSQTGTPKEWVFATLAFR